MNPRPPIRDFELVREVEVPERRSQVRVYRHRTGCDVVSVLNEDPNKVFAIVFRTVPPDSTGVAHILEHSVLCGSRKYPVKEPFVELLKGSLKTFLNAFTYPDKTCYPVASSNERDLHHLMDVYLDAVFHPLLTPKKLRQEGWHYELVSPDGPLTIQGVVYNEMKGVYSSPDSRFGELCQQSLFPDTPYGLDSGGDPREIPRLTFTAFRDFHRRFYHPSNAFVFFAGDNDPDARLRHLAEFLNRFRRKPVRAEIPLQPPFPEPRRVVERFPVQPDSPGADRGLAAVNWVLPESTDRVRVMVWGLLNYLLVGTPASPLYQALVDSGLGEEVLAHLETHLRQMTFSVGLRGIRPSDAPRMESLIFETLGRIAREGVHPELVEAGLNRLEFQLRENNTGRFPRGLALMLSAAQLWTYGGDPVEGIAFERALQEVRRIVSEGDALWARLIGEHLLGNRHRSLVVMEPDPELGPRREAEERERLERILRRWSRARRERIVREAEELKAAQARPDPPEALATIPTLRLEDLNPRVERIPCDDQTRDGVRWMFHEQFTSGVVYLTLGFPVRRLPADLLPVLPLLSRALFETGTSREDMASFSRRIGRLTGGVDAGPAAYTLLDRTDATAWLWVGGKCLAPRIEDLCAILHDALTDARLDFAERIRQMLLEEKAGSEAEIIPRGSSVVLGRLGAQYSEAGWFREVVDGVEHFFWLRTMADRADETPTRLIEPLLEARRRLFVRGGALVNITAAAADRDRVERAVADLLARLPEGAEPCEADGDWARRLAPGHDLLYAPSEVNYVGCAMDLRPTGHPFHGSALVIYRYLSNTWLWEQVRVQGGAYGCSAIYDRSTRLLTMASYRDPHVERTLQVFSQAARFLMEHSISDDEIRRAIIGTIGEMDAPRLPDALGILSMERRLIGLTDEERQRVREEILSTHRSHFRDFGEALSRAPARIAVLGSRERIGRLPTPPDEPRREITLL